ncbi:hypothetical protein CIB84_011898 [Bambusicola thoracicus]|uniref:Uncharacterized protein n=1 Tax=Bambusicola thoracicus TaxID=9083 RepID=A0A2P4SJS2_BAMTH|nr:hypothetical protein CIB84_011898 [Bambusicola thoracicus]
MFWIIALSNLSTATLLLPSLGKLVPAALPGGLARSDHGHWVDL